MHYVKHFDINGVDTKQVACIELHGKPNAATEGSVGVLGVDVDSPTHDVYKCVAVNGSIYTWELLSSGMSIISTTISSGGVESIQFPYADLLMPTLYVVKKGDLVLDTEGYLYQIDSLDSTYCVAKYCGTQIAKYGKSAYDFAVKQGFEGSEEEWIASLKGETGDSGVYLGEEEPTDPHVNVWVNPEGITTDDINNNTFSNALKGEATGEIIALTDISPIEHEVEVKVRNKNLYFNSETKISTIRETMTCETIANKSDFILNGTIDTDTPFSISTGIPLKAGTYTISIHGTNNLRDGYDRIYIIDEDGIILKNYILNGAPKTFTIAKDVSATVKAVLGQDTVYNNAHCSIQIEAGSTATNYVPHNDLNAVKLIVQTNSKTTEYAVDAAGAVNGVICTGELTKLYTDATGAIIDVKYNRDINKAFAELANAIISLGGNV
jgi:hypothetical protein